MAVDEIKVGVQTDQVPGMLQKALVRGLAKVTYSSPRTTLSEELWSFGH